MKKTLIIIGVILIILIVGLWAFFFFTGGMPKSTDDVFARFGQSGEAPQFEPEPEPEEEDYEYAEDPTPTQSTKRLRQLTTRPVAGAVAVGNSIRFVERGTGHVYDIDTRGGAERIVSGTTQPRTLRATFSGKGDAVALTSEIDGVVETILGVLSEEASGGGLLLTALPADATEVGFSRDGSELYFFVPNARGGIGYAYNLETTKTRELFSIPLHDVRILWGDTTYLYTTPSGKTLGFVYKIGDDGILSYVTKGGRGLMAMRHASGTVVTSLKEEDESLVTRDTKTGEIPYVALFTEKCTVYGTWTPYLACATPTSFPPGTYPDDWFKGVVGFSDRIVRVDSSESSVYVWSDLKEESGRPLDVLSIGSDPLGGFLYFINKYDNALWLLDLR